MDCAPAPARRTRTPQGWPDLAANQRPAPDTYLHGALYDQQHGPGSYASQHLPLAMKLKASGRRLLGIGGRHSTNTYWAKACHEFRYHDQLLECWSLWPLLLERLAPIRTMQPLR